MRIETVTIPGQGTFNRVCDFCRVGPLYPLTYLNEEREYCSQECRGNAMKHSQFGGAEVHHPTCDHCHGPIKVVAFRGRYGRYCCQACSETAESNLTEKEKEEIMARKQAAKKATKAPAKKAAAKKAAPAADKKEMFRPGATKYDIWKMLEPGNPVKVADLEEITKSAGKTTQLIGFVLGRVRKEGYQVARDKEARTVQVTK